MDWEAESIQYFPASGRLPDMPAYSGWNLEYVATIPFILISSEYHCCLFPFYPALPPSMAQSASQSLTISLLDAMILPSIPFTYQSYLVSK